MTFRLAGHYVGDAQQYRSKEELAAIRDKCPIERLKRHLIERGVEAHELDSIGQQAGLEVQQAADRARAGPAPIPRACSRTSIAGALSMRSQAERAR